MIEGDAKVLIQEALKSGTSDIHMMPTRDLYFIYYRMNGQLVKVSEYPIDQGKKMISYFKYLADMDTGEKRRPQSGSTSYITDVGEIELRFSTLPSVLLLESLVIRLLKQQSSQASTVYTYFPQDIDVLRKLIRRKSGLLLFSGPVGSGKTTTIYQLLRERIAKESLQVITMEDPVEMYEEAFLQIEVNERANITYESIIRASLRHHPDILMIGEIRDEETARMAIRGALTGHLMIATIHAKNALGVIGRLQELQVTQEQLTQTLIGVCSQRLIPRYCLKCKGACRPSCRALSTYAKRSALFEILSSQTLQNVLSSHKVEATQWQLNDKLRKAWGLGYIDEETYIKFEVV